jgi:membrane associated rhomboid family serine protease
MLILGDESHHRGKWPYVTVLFVLINIAMYGLQVMVGERLTNGYALVPKEITTLKDITKPQKVKIKAQEVVEDRHGFAHAELRDHTITINHYPGPFPIILTLITSMFLHGDIVHLIGNMWFLIVFGRNVECALNHGRFIAFYLLCGIVGGMAHVLSDRHSLIPAIGASGAISGVLGAYVAIHPLNKIKCWFGWWLGVIELPALVIIGVWFLLQYVSAFVTLEHPELGDGVAYWDHLGGFATGIGFIWGTIFWLKWQQARAEQGEVVEAPAAAEAAAVQTAPVGDPFASFLPPTAIQAGPPKPAAPRHVAPEPAPQAQPEPAWTPPSSATATAVKAAEPKREAFDPFASFLPTSKK